MKEQKKEERKITPLITLERRGTVVICSELDLEFQIRPDEAPINLIGKAVSNAVVLIGSKDQGDARHMHKVLLATEVLSAWRNGSRLDEIAHVINIRR